MSDNLEREYARLSIDYAKRRKYGLRTIALALFIYVLMASSPLITLLGAATNSFVTAPLGFAFLVSLILLAVFALKARKIKLSGQQVTAIKTYNAYIKAKAFFEDGLHDQNKGGLKRVLKELILDFQLWKGKKT